MIKTQYIRLDMTPGGTPPVFFCSQYDVGRPLGMVVYNGGEAVDLSTYTCTIEATRTDGTAITAAVTTDGNIGAFATTATMTNQKDRYPAKLVLFDSNSRRVASLAFILCVTPATMDENAESIEEDASLYQQYTGTVQALIVDIRKDITDLQSQTHDTVADMIADPNLKVGMYVRTGGYSAVNDGGGMLYHIDTAQDDSVYEYETLANGLIASRVATLSDSKFVADTNHQGDPYAGICNNGASVVSALLDVCSTYEDNGDKLYYGHNSALDYGEHDMSLGLQDGKYQIDCSAFAQLALAGITFESSRYNGNNRNEFASIYSFFPYLTVADMQVDSGFADYRLTFDIARFAYRHGYAFIPNYDWSNVRPGDVVFIQDAYTPTGQFLDIDHCMIYIGRTGQTDNLIFYECGGNGSHRVSVSSNSVCHRCERTLSFMQNNTKLVARFPLGTADGESCGCMISEPTLPASFSGGTRSDPYICDEIKAGEWYTVILTVSGSNNAFYVTDTGHLCVAPGHGIKATFVHTYRAEKTFNRYQIGSYRNTDTDISFYDFQIVRGYASKVTRIQRLHKNILTTVEGTYSNGSANAWEYTGLSITTKAGHITLISASTNWTSGASLGLGFDTSATSTTPAFRSESSNHLASSSAFMIVGQVTLYLYSKRGSVSVHPNTYQIRAVDMGPYAQNT